MVLRIDAEIKAPKQNVAFINSLASAYLLFKNSTNRITSISSELLKVCNLSVC
jgi:hypothetical protein